MFPVIVYLTSVYMTTWLLLFSEILDPLYTWLIQRSEFFKAMLGCMICTSFWISLALLFLVKDLPTSLFIMMPLVSMFFVRATGYFLGDLD